ncbi:hypothetical protein ACRS6B_27870 [Nocardia asteroides]
MIRAHEAAGKDEATLAIPQLPFPIVPDGILPPQPAPMPQRQRYSQEPGTMEV